MHFQEVEQLGNSNKLVIISNYAAFTEAAQYAAAKYALRRCKAEKTERTMTASVPRLGRSAGRSPPSAPSGSVPAASEPRWIQSRNQQHRRLLIFECIYPVGMRAKAQRPSGYGLDSRRRPYRRRGQRLQCEQACNPGRCDRRDIQLSARGLWILHSTGNRRRASAGKQIEQ